MGSTRGSVVRIELLGTSFSIQTDEDPAYMAALVADLKKRIVKLSQSTKVSDPLKLAILAGIVMLDELRHKSALEPETLQLAPGDMEAIDLLESLDKRLFEAGL